MNVLRNVADHGAVALCPQKNSTRSMLPILTILYGACVYPIGILTRSRNLLNFQHHVVMTKSSALVRALIQFLSSALTPTWVTIKFKRKN